LEAEDLQPIEMLVNLVISERMNPWDIDIARLTNRFLEEIRKMREINLRISGKTLLAASFLLRLKSESILEKEEPEDGQEYFYENEVDYRELNEIKPITPPVRRRNERKTTLFELIAALQQALSEEMIRKNFPSKKNERKLVIKIDEEDIKEKISNIYSMLINLWKFKEEITFSELIKGKPRAKIVEILFTLLFLHMQKKIYIYQKELFGEIFITKRC